MNSDIPSPTSSMEVHHGSPPPDPRILQGNGVASATQERFATLGNGSDSRKPSGSNLLEELPADNTRNGYSKTGTTNGMLPRSDPSDMASPPRKRRKLDLTSSYIFCFPEAYGQELKMPTAEDKQQPGDEPDNSPNEKNEVEAGNEGADA
ncbi:hypothetical protein H112_06704 [Trichophyton rubrum D6]|uniref:Uncharacterized protein n=4 Tax=Trichophyton TaxID=5550 RepID=A0A178F0D4_TRIRU|nr:uncharacterized protein TERG_02053 [Trichophyton rubrum CBS 118892]EZF12394.1 hypothetical protein H100_06720 [Trichophyton rubrum MR850]EZF39364.1 hypothetical protein H102_06687 [Trichophyton rubrum CBS 100081]EZF49818.1 hypothetical protein H103_06711 [Trichophyton rubrum CBS 288.86]EZF60476.1 hypothetical protein H104_06666 [Trichophyton rubrum CBS 289.86]EZF71100.1 hypothetical protein H105_06724 [Trichophyton soudanense CBS 452.61]EZF81839.1 hypothetical protein H110_06708 [Trichophy